MYCGAEHSASRGEGSALDVLAMEVGAGWEGLEVLVALPMKREGDSEEAEKSTVKSWNRDASNDDLSAVPSALQAGVGSDSKADEEA
jgi:hypothetical protein